MKALVVILFLLGGSYKAACMTHSSDSTKHRKMTIDQVLTKYNDKWLAIPGVIGTGEGKSDNKPCIMIFVSDHLHSVQKRIPDIVEGYKVVFHQTGEIKPIGK